MDVIPVTHLIILWELKLQVMTHALNHLILYETSTLKKLLLCLIVNFTWRKLLTIKTKHGNTNVNNAYLDLF